MIEIREITDCLETISPYSAEELHAYSFLIENEKSRIEKAVNQKSFKDTARAVLLAAARVNYRIALIRQGGGVTSFAAGDVKITENGEELKNAGALLDEISADCKELADGDGFAFRTV